MLNLKGLVAKIRRSQNEKGQGLVEYALILVLVAIVVIAVLLTLGPTVAGVYCQVANALQPGSCTAAAGPVTIGPYTYGTDIINDACGDMSLSSGSQVYMFATNNPPQNGDTFYWTSESSPPASGLASSPFITATCP